MLSEESLERTERNGPVSFGQWPTAALLPEQKAFPFRLELVHFNDQCNFMIAFTTVIIWSIHELMPE